MRLLLFAVAVLIGAIGLTLLTQDESGYVLINLSGWTIETSFAFAVVLLLVFFSLIYFVLRLLAGTLAAPGHLNAWRGEKRARRARQATNRGLISLAEGKWKKAERDLSRYADRSEAPLLNYLSAAYAAHMQGDERGRDEFLALAYEANPDAELAVGLTQAELQMKGHQQEQALATLMQLQGKNPKHGRVLHLLQQLHEQMGSWEEVLALLPRLEKYKLVDAEKLNVLERRSWEALLHQARDSGRVENLRSLWSRIPRQQRRQPVLLNTYALGLLEQGAGREAEAMLREAIQREWNEETVRMYGHADSGDALWQIEHAEGWLQQHSHNPVLLLTLGRLALRARLWGKARSYLEASAGLEASGETHCLLGELLQSMGEEKIASEHFRQGLLLASGVGQKGTLVTLEHFPLAENGEAEDSSPVEKEEA